MQLETGPKSGIEIELYNGVYSLAALYKGTDGLLRKEWALRQIGRDKHAEKDTPIKVVIGDAAMALKVADAIYDHFAIARPKDDPPTPQADQLPDDDVPF